MKLIMASTFSFSLATLALLLLSVSLSSVSATPVGSSVGSGPEARCPPGETMSIHNRKCVKTAAETINEKPAKQPLVGKKSIKITHFSIHGY
jgi:hypothetical protein